MIARATFTMGLLLMALLMVAAPATALHMTLMHAFSVLAGT